MLPPMTPGVYVKEVATGRRPIGAVGTSTVAFLGVAQNARAHVNRPIACNGLLEFLSKFGDDAGRGTDLSRAVRGFYDNGGGRCYVLNLGEEKAPLAGNPLQRTGLTALEPIDEIALVAAPGRTSLADYSAVITHCERMEDRFGILDAPDLAEIDPLKTIGTESASGSETPKEGAKEEPKSKAASESRGARPSNSSYCAFYFPYLVVRETRTQADGTIHTENVKVPPSGHIAGIYARVDATRGVHKAPAGVGEDEKLRGSVGLSYEVSRFEQGELNRKGVNCIRYFPDSGRVVWGARTLAPEASGFRYINVRRLFLMVKESIAEGTKWTVFEPHDPLLWDAVKRDVRAFLMTLWRGGALFGATPDEAFFVKCDAENNPPEIRDQGLLIIDVGIAPVKPAEFVVFQIGQFAGGDETTGAAEA